MNAATISSVQRSLALYFGTMQSVSSGNGHSGKRVVNYGEYLFRA
jgi:hypothetical protein